MNIDLQRAESPIEERFAAALASVSPVDVELEPQVPIQGTAGVYRVDFVARVGPRMIVIECDGAQFHDYAKDFCRDRDLLLSTEVTDILRLGGGDICYGLAHCVSLLQGVAPELFDAAAGRPTLSRIADLSASPWDRRVGPVYRFRVQHDELEVLRPEVSRYQGILKPIGRVGKERAALQVNCQAFLGRGVDHFSNIVFNAFPHAGVWVR